MSETNEAGAMNKEYATQDQIAFFERLRNGDDPVHEAARTELVELADATLEILEVLSVRKIDHDEDVQRVLRQLSILAGYEVEPEEPVDGFELEIVGPRGGYALDDEELMGDLSEKVKGRFSDDERKVLALLETEGVELTEAFNDSNRRVYRFVTKDAAVAKQYGFEVWA
jgi:hypothetical protein